MLLCILFYSCTKQGGFLGQTTTTDLNEDAVFSDSARSMDFLAQIYTNIDFSFNPARFNGLAGLEACCDEAEGPSSTGVTTYNQFATGSVSAYSISTDAWSIPYSNIRAVNQFLAHLPTIPFNDALKQRTKGEVLFLRAWYYSIMLKHYGGIPLIGDTVYDVTDKINTVRNTYDECVTYITQQCDAAAAILPLSYSGGDFGRVTKGACLALKAKVLLYAASPLFNGGGIAQSEPLKSVTG
ncbi:MAG TPA: RagB/SusD family nutrient uptake outer membrane protein, partial [Parafilimonas sp.]